MLAHQVFHRPDLFLHEEWAVAIGGDKVQTVLTRAHRPYPNYPEYNLVEQVVVKGAQVIEIYRRAGDALRKTSAQDQAPAMQSRFEGLVLDPQNRARLFGREPVHVAQQHRQPVDLRQFA